MVYNAGMLGSWMRMKYPHILDGVIAASAPIWAFPGERPAVDSNAFAKIVTRDATPAGGASKACAGDVAYPHLGIYNVNISAVRKATACMPMLHC